MTACKKKSQDHGLVMRCAPVGGINSVQLNSALVAGIEKFRRSSCEGVAQNWSGRRGDLGVVSERKTFSEIDRICKK